MGELSFLTIIISLAICSLLVYAVFQYMKVRLTILEQSHKEQAMILQQFIEESSNDIHRLYQYSSSSNGGAIPTNGSIILEYANDKPVAYNEPHTIHLDTALFQNKRNSNLIEISSDSEDTTDDSEGSDSESRESSEGSERSESSESSDSDSESESDNRENQVDVINILNNDNDNDNDNDDVPLPLFIPEIVSSPEIKLVTVDLGIIHEQEITAVELPIETTEGTVETSVSSTPVIANGTSSSTIPLTSMSVPDLKHLLKEKYKNHPEKHAEIQKLKKAELIFALQQTQ
jgi:hypothetical protein